MNFIKNIEISNIVNLIGIIETIVGSGLLSING